MLFDAAGLAIAPADVDLDDERSDTGSGLDGVPTRLTDDIRVEGRDAREALRGAARIFAPTAWKDFRSASTTFAPSALALARLLASASLATL